MTTETQAPDPLHQRVKRWAEQHGIRFVNRSYGQYSTDTISRDALQDLARGAQAPEGAQAVSYWPSEHKRADGSVIQIDIVDDDGRTVCQCTDHRRAKADAAVILAALASPRASEGAPLALPPPDTHCWDDGAGEYVWSYSDDLVRSIVSAALAAPAPQAPVALAQEQWPPTPSVYQGDQYIGYSRTDLLKYAQEVLTAHGIPAPKEPKA